MSSRALPRLLLGLALVAAGLLTTPHSAATAAPGPGPVPTPTLSEPPAGIHGHALWDSYHDLTPFGYTDREYFVSGTARSTSGGAPAPFTTRIIVARPTAARAFNGTVMLDWVNVTAQFENPVDTMEGRQTLLREGFAFVHVSAQAAGLCCTPLTPKVYDPVRYAALTHPGDGYAEDIFSQVAKVLRSHRGPGQTPLDPMPGLTVRRVIATGQSQSASRLYGYVNSTQASAGVIDGFIIHGGGAKTFLKPLTVPVIHLLSDNEAKTDPPTKDPKYRLMEVAGTAHSGFFIGYQSVFGSGPRTADQAPQTKAQYDATIDKAGNYGQLLDPMLGTCVLAGSTMPMHYAVSTALHQLNRWVSTGKAPGVTPRFTFAGTARATDQYGNTLGGIRFPPIVHPVAEYHSTQCPLGGLTVPFTDQKIQDLYGSFEAYQGKMASATDTAVRQGWLLPPDAIDQMRRVCQAKVRFAVADTGTCKPYSPPVFEAAAVAVATPAQPAAAPQSAPAAPVVTLPTTGSLPWLPAAGVLLLALAARGRRVRS